MAMSVLDAWVLCVNHKIYCTKKPVVRGWAGYWVAGI